MPTINHHGAIIIDRSDNIATCRAISNRIELISAHGGMRRKDASITFTRCIRINHIVMCAFSHLIKTVIIGCNKGGFLHPGFRTAIGFISLQLADDVCKLRRAAYRKAPIENIRDKFGFIIHGEEIQIRAIWRFRDKWIIRNAIRAVVVITNQQDVHRWIGAYVLGFDVILDGSCGVSTHLRNGGNAHIVALCLLEGDVTA